MSRSQKNSFITIAEQISLLNRNSVEFLTKISDIVSSQDSTISVSQLDEQGNETNYALPTVGKLKSDIESINNNIKRLSGLNDNNVHVIDGKSTKKIYLSDLNREPNNIERLDNITKFNTKNNWFFESLMDPMISVQFDLSNKVDNDVDGVISRRYIVRFKTNDDGTLTEEGLLSKSDFTDRFINNNDISMKDFTDWYNNPTNNGLLYNDLKYDEQYYSFDYQEVSDHGVFSVLKQEIDSINNKLWFHIYPFTYTTKNSEEKVLTKGNELVLNRRDSVTRWEILETSTSSSDFRVRLNRIEGYDPIPTGNNMLKIYGSVDVRKTVSINLGFDEYIVIFMKPTNSKNNIKGSGWSKGTGLYTNDLVLSSDNNISMSQYYLNTVNDYGELLKDLINRNIPSKYALKPDAPVLISDNFKVVQINKHLTDNVDSKKIKDLNSEKNKIKTKLDQVNTAITQKNKELSVKKYQSVAEKNTSQNELSKLIKEQESLSKLLYSVTTQIKSQKDTINKSEPKFRLRGFWDIPEPKTQPGYKPQQVVQFVIQYRYSSKEGTENQTDGFIVNSADNKKTGYFSNWISLDTDRRKRVFNEKVQEWEWEVEDISDADTPNINQLDIPIQQGEKIEIRILSISEASYPDTKSDWSNTITKVFPDDLNDILDSNDFILKEAEQDNLLIQFEQTLESRGINRHIRDSFTMNDKFIAHKDEDIQTNYKSETGESFTLSEYLNYLTDKIKSLEDIVYSAKGRLKVSIFNGVEEIVIDNNSTVNLDFSCQNYAKEIKKGTYDNKLYIISDCYLKFENVANGQLTFLVRESYTGDTSIRTDFDNLPCLVDKNNDFVVQEPYQYLYFCDNSSGEQLYSGSTLHNNLENDSIYDMITDTTKQPGLSGVYINKNRTGNESSIAYNVLNDDWDKGDKFATLICPVVDTIDDLISKENIGTNYKTLNSNDYIIVPINIYWKFKTGTDTDYTIIHSRNKIIGSNVGSASISSNMEHNKKLRVRLNPSSINTNFDFELKFNLKIKNTR